MRVLFVSHSAGAAGAELSLVEAVRALCAASVDVHVLLPREGPLAERLAPHTQDVVVAAEPWPWWVTGFTTGTRARARARLSQLVHSGDPVRAIRGTIRRLQPDVVVTNTLSFPHGAVAAALERVPHVWWVHEFGREDFAPMLYGDRLTFKLIGTLSRQVIACSEVVAQKLRRYIPPEKVRVVRYAMEMPELPPTVPSADGALRLLTLGRMSPRKGQEDSVRATAILTELGIDVRLTLVGGSQETPYRRALAELASESAARERVFFHYSTTSPFAYLAEADVFLMTSRCEAFGRVTVEAMKAARPVVATKSGGNLDLVRDGWNGLLYRPGDPDDLARQVKRLHDDRALASELGAHGKAWACETFTLERYRAQLLAVLSEAANSGDLWHEPRKGVEDVAHTGV